MLVKVFTDNTTLLEDIAEAIINEYSNGYYPHWKLSFGEYFRSWHLRNESRELIAHAVLSGMKKISIKLFAQNRHPDFEFMGNYIKSLPYSKSL